MSKLYRLASLAKQAEISVCVDDAQNVRQISQAAVIFGATVNIIVEVNVGQDRCGIEPGEPVVALAKEIMALPNLVFKGIQTYQG
jgi:3-hydroxy-D-aspartate aldolase